MEIVRIFKALVAIIAIAILAGCTVKKQDHGYDFDGYSLKNLQLNSSKEAVLKIMGSPSAISSISDNSWYYISLETKNIVILRPKINKYKVLELIFKHNKLSDIQLYTNDKLKKLEFKKWETPVQGSDNNLLQDFFYNMGRFNKHSKEKK